MSRFQDVAKQSILLIDLKLKENKIFFFFDAPQFPNSLIFVKVHRVRLFVWRVASMRMDHWRNHTDGGNPVGFETPIQMLLTFCLHKISIPNSHRKQHVSIINNNLWMLLEKLSLSTVRITWNSNLIVQIRCSSLKQIEERGFQSIYCNPTKYTWRLVDRAS
jgi:hypothetical protein